MNTKKMISRKGRKGGEEKTFPALLSSRDSSAC
jgi:hypothetical protein